jgi:hypothetical protein
MSSARVTSDDTSLAITTSRTTTGVLNYGGVCHAMVYVPNESSITTLTFYPIFVISGSDVIPSNAAKDSTDTAISLTVAANTATQMPLSLSAAKRIAIVGNAAGTIYVQAKS